MLKSKQHNNSIVVDQLATNERESLETHCVMSKELSQRRLRLANTLIEGLSTIEKKTGVFLIKPIATIRSVQYVS